MASDNKKKTPYVYIDIDSSEQPPIIAHRKDRGPRSDAGPASQPGVVMLGDVDDGGHDDDEAQAIVPLVVPIFRNAIDPDYDDISSSVAEPALAPHPARQGASGRAAEPRGGMTLDEKSSVEAYLQKQAASERKRGSHEAPARRQSGASRSSRQRDAGATTGAGAGTGAGYAASARRDAPGKEPERPQEQPSPFPSFDPSASGVPDAPWGASSQPAQQPSQQMAIQPYNPAYAQWYQQGAYGMPYPGAAGPAGAWGAGYPYADPMMAAYPYAQGYGYGYDAAAAGMPYAPSAGQGYAQNPYAAPEGAYAAPAGSSYGDVTPSGMPAPSYPSQQYPSQSPYAAPSASGSPYAPSASPQTGAPYSAPGASGAFDYAAAGYPGSYGAYAQQTPPGGVGYPPSAAAAQAAPAPDGGASEDIGKPVLDEQAIAESSIFDEPSVSLEEGMRGMESDHRKHRKVIAIVLIVVAVVALALILVLGIISGSGSTQGSSSEAQSQTQASQSSSSSSSSKSSKAGSAASSGSSGSSSSSSSSTSGSQAGYMSFQYTATTANGVSYTCMETVTFKPNGDCEFTTMDMEFPDAESATAFVDSLSNDYGSNFTLDSQNGAEATVTIDNSGLHLNRKEYEQALRASAEDVVILEKK